MTNTATQIDQTVALEIIAQLGGRMMFMMTGGKIVGIKNNSVTIKLGRNGKNVTQIVITLNGSDLYDLRTERVRMGKITTLETSTDNFVDMLRKQFETMTGLYLSL